MKDKKKGEMKSKKKSKNKINSVVISSIVVVLSLALILVIKLYNRDLYLNASLPQNDSVCPSGKYFSEGECLFCPSGSYCYEDNRYYCPEGTGSLMGSSTIMSCTSCAKGYYGTADGEGCLSCPSGTTTNNIGAKSINECI